MNVTATSRARVSWEKVGGMIAILLLACALMEELVRNYVLQPNIHNYSKSTFFDGAVLAHGGNYTAHPFTSVSTPVVTFELVRRGEYKIFPKDTYTAKVSVQYSLSEPQAWLLIAEGETFTTSPLHVKWQWEEGTIAQIKEWPPTHVDVEVTRKSDGKVAKSFLRVQRTERIVR